MDFIESMELRQRYFHTPKTFINAYLENQSKTHLVENGSISIEMIALGPPGTYSEEAALKLKDVILKLFNISKIDVRLELKTSLIDTLCELKENDSSVYKIVVSPLENVIAGPVDDVCNCLIELSSLHKLTNEINVLPVQTFIGNTIPINHCLASLESLDLYDENCNINYVFSHSHALKQCKKYLDNHIPNAIRIETLSTADSVVQLKNFISENPIMKNKALVICSEYCAEINGLNIIEKGIEDAIGNYTTFLSYFNKALIDLMQNNSLEYDSLSNQTVFNSDLYGLYCVTRENEDLFTMLSSIYSTNGSRFLSFNQISNMNDSKDIAFFKILKKSNDNLSILLQIRIEDAEKKSLEFINTTLSCNCIGFYRLCETHLKEK